MEKKVSKCWSNVAKIEVQDKRKTLITCSLSY